MADQFPCPNPTCTHVFTLAELQTAAQVGCPRCGFRMQGRGPAQPAPPTRPAPAVARPVAPAVPLAAPVQAPIVAATLVLPAAAPMRQAKPVQPRASPARPVVAAGGAPAGPGSDVAL